jgi:hypothetical protein
MRASTRSVPRAQRWLRQKRSFLTLQPEQGQKARRLAFAELRRELTTSR